MLVKVPSYVVKSTDGNSMEVSGLDVYFLIFVVVILLKMCLAGLRLCAYVTTWELRGWMSSYASRCKYAAHDETIFVIHDSYEYIYLP